MHDTHIHLDLLTKKIKIHHNNDYRDFTSDLNLTQKHLSSHHWVIQSTVSYHNFLAVKSAFQVIDKVYFLFGTHPEIVDSRFDEKSYLNEQSNLLNELKSNKVVGIGECGLDYYYTQDPEIIKIQKKLFEAQINLSQDYNLPLVIHCREAFSDTISMLKSFPYIKGNFLVHCFTGDIEILKQILDMGGKVAFGGIITFGKNADYLRESLTYCPNDSWVLETDSPYLSPSPHRGQICLPEYIDYVALKVAELKSISKEQVWNISETNSKNLFTKIKI